MIRFTLLSIVAVSLLSCSTQRASLPNAGSINSSTSLQSRELELSQQAAQDASKSAREAVIESEKVQKQIAELKKEVRTLSELAAGCSDIAKKSDQKRAAAAALRAKKEAEEKKALEAVAVALPPPTATVKGDYSKSDAPPGYYPEKADPHAPPAPHDHH